MYYYMYHTCVAHFLVSLPKTDSLCIAEIYLAKYLEFDLISQIKTLHAKWGISQKWIRSDTHKNGGVWLKWGFITWFTMQHIIYVLFETKMILQFWQVDMGLTEKREKAFKHLN